MNLRECRTGLAEVDGQGSQPQHVRGTQARALKWDRELVQQEGGCRAPFPAGGRQQPYLVMEELAEPGEHSGEERASTCGHHKAGRPGALPAETMASPSPAQPSQDLVDKHSGTGGLSKKQEVPQTVASPVQCSLLPHPHWIKSAQPPSVAQQEAKGPGTDGHCRHGTREKLCSRKGAHPEEQATCRQTAQTTCPVGQNWRLPLGSDRKMSAEDPRPAKRNTQRGTCMSRILYYLHTFDRFAFGEETPKQTGTRTPTPKLWEHDRSHAVPQSPLVKCYSREQAREGIL